MSRTWLKIDGSPDVNRTGFTSDKQTTKQENRMAKYHPKNVRATQKSQSLTVQLQWPIAELIQGAHQDIEAICAQVGLTIMNALMDHEIQSQIGPWGEQRAYRHGHQEGYVVYAGRKLPIRRPRWRSRDKRELPLHSYKNFQQEGRMQRAVARKLVRHCSSRDYEGALDECVQGYGIKRSSVSRHWKVATAAQLKQLLERPIPKDLLALVIDAQYFSKQCIIVALGIDKEGRKHVLGLWQGSTETGAIVKGLLEDLISRGLDPERPLLFVIDGHKALRSGIARIFGDRALVQRCRVHKQRNIVEHLPKEKQNQAAWRLRAAWAKSDPKEAQKELRAVVNWLRSINPCAASSLEEGLEETLTLQNLGVNHRLACCLSSTNMIESCFSRTGSLIQRVKQWHDGEMVHRWAAAALMLAQKGFRRIRAF